MVIRYHLNNYLQNVYHKKNFRKLNCSNKGSRYLSNHLFVDDVVLFIETSGKLQNVIKEINRQSLEVEPKLIKEKTSHIQQICSN